MILAEREVVFTEFGEESSFCEGAKRQDKRVEKAWGGVRSDKTNKGNYCKRNVLFR
jgi:hypothetical protein